jgi:hypothetical protein
MAQFPKRAREIAEKVFGFAMCHRWSLEGLKKLVVSSGIPEGPVTLNGVQCHMSGLG